MILYTLVCFIAFTISLKEGYIMIADNVEVPAIESILNSILPNTHVDMKRVRDVSAVCWKEVCTPYEDVGLHVLILFEGRRNSGLSPNSVWVVEAEFNSHLTKLNFVQTYKNLYSEASSYKSSFSCHANSAELDKLNFYLFGESAISGRGQPRREKANYDRFDKDDDLDA